MGGGLFQRRGEQGGCQPCAGRGVPVQPCSDYRQVNLPGCPEQSSCGSQGTAQYCTTAAPTQSCVQSTTASPVALGGIPPGCTLQAKPGSPGEYTLTLPPHASGKEVILIYGPPNDMHGVGLQGFQKEGTCIDAEWKARGAFGTQSINGQNVREINFNLTSPTSKLLLKIDGQTYEVPTASIPTAPAMPKVPAPPPTPPEPPVVAPAPKAVQSPVVPGEKTEAPLPRPSPPPIPLSDPTETPQPAAKQPEAPMPRPAVKPIEETQPVGPSAKVEANPKVANPEFVPWNNAEGQQQLNTIAKTLSSSQNTWVGVHPHNPRETYTVQCPDGNKNLLILTTRHVKSDNGPVLVDRFIFKRPDENTPWTASLLVQENGVMVAQPAASTAAALPAVATGRLKATSPEAALPVMRGQYTPVNKDWHYTPLCDSQLDTIVKENASSGATPTIVAKLSNTESATLEIPNGNSVRLTVREVNPAGTFTKVYVLSRIQDGPWIASLGVDSGKGQGAQPGSYSDVEFKRYLAPFSDANSTKIPVTAAIE